MSERVRGNRKFKGIWVDSRKYGFKIENAKYNI